MEDDEKESDGFSFNLVELLVLEDRWKKGKLNDYVSLVKAFIEEQQETIRIKLGDEANEDQLARGLIDLLLANGTLDQASEMLEQKQEILKELWICAERGDHDKNRITDEWIKQHASKWRRWRILVYTFIAVKVMVGIYRDIDC